MAVIIIQFIQEVHSLVRQTSLRSKCSWTLKKRSLSEERS